MVDKRSDSVLAGDFLACVDVAFSKRDFAGRGVFLCERLEGRRDSFAGATPGCVNCSESVFFFSFFSSSSSLLRGRGELTVNDDHGILGEDAGELGGRAENLDLGHGCCLLGLV